MENFRSQSCKDIIAMNMKRSYSYKPSTLHDLRSYSTSYANKSLSLPPPPPPPPPLPVQVENNTKINKCKGNLGSTKNWVFNDPEMQRKKRVAGYKGYSLEGKVKGSFKKSFRWIKESYSQVVHGYK